MTSSPLDVKGTRDYAQGEIFLLTEQEGGYGALVYNTTGFGPCPEEEFEAIDTEALAKETGCDRVWKNPRRFWMMDELTLELAGEPRELGGIMFNLAADMHMPADFDPGRDQSAMAYHPMQIHRVTTYRFLAGRPVFLLRSPEGVTWVMQTYTNHKATDLTAEVLAGLGDRLTLPEGWEFSAKILDEDLVIDTHGLANIVPDDLANMYQGCIDGVNNFDPWQ
ncbi:MAG: hypothetical protein IPM45_07865 [Acidimicrobiales bacterium]|nr:hypothetical protein [Acidimicrobiales bacterium]